jgi:hypothetical protein
LKIFLGADRKHKQDREKVMKRPITEQEKFSPQYDCTVLTDLSVDSIYIPPSRGISPVQVPVLFINIFIEESRNAGTVFKKKRIHTFIR